MIRKPKICFWDIETSGVLAYTWNLYPSNGIPYQSIVDDWFIISACWKFADGKRIQSVSVADDPKRFKKNPKDDYYVIKTLREMLDDVDVLVAHNGDKFDIKSFNARLIYHRLPPLPKILTVDTLKEVKKVAKFTSNRLDFLAQKLGVGHKIIVSSGLWKRACAGEAKAVHEMVKYNKGDVDALEGLYLALRPYMKSHPNIAEPSTCNCPKCDSDNIRKHKPRITSGGIRYQQFQCQNCGGYFQSGSPLEKPKSKL